MRYEEILSIATITRLTLEQVDITNSFYDIKLWDSFPNGCCKLTSHLLMYYLSQVFQVPQDEMSLFANARVNGGTHAWARVSGYHVDITSGQFGRDPVIVSPDSPWPDCIEGPTEHQYSSLGLASEFKPEFDLICEKIK